MLYVYKNCLTRPIQSTAVASQDCFYVQPCRMSLVHVPACNFLFCRQFDWHVHVFREILPA